MDTEQLLAAQAAVIKSREMRIAELEALLREVTYDQAFSLDPGLRKRIDEALR